MKRSEMVELIAKELEDMDSVSFTEPLLPKEVYKQDANSLLSMLEKIGMKPPYYNPFDRSLGEAETQIEYYVWQKE